MTQKSGMLKWIVWSLAAFFSFSEILFRVSPSIMVPELMASFGVEATALGLLTSCFYYAYAPMQLPVGLLLDRFGAKRLLVFASLICGIGAVIFGVSVHFLEAAGGRFLLGFGSSFAFVAMVYVCSHWFPQSKRALLVGLANSIGMIGAFCGQGPLGIVLQKLNWRITLILLGVTGFFLAFLITFIVEKEEPIASCVKQTKRALLKSLFKGLSIVSKCRYTWLNAITALLFYMTTSTFGELWGIPFLQSTYGMSKHAAGFTISMIFIGWLCGGPCIGWLSDLLRKRKRLVGLCILFALSGLLPVLYWTTMPIYLLYFFLFIVGFFSAGELLNFTLSTELNPPHVKGAAIAFTNCVVSFGSGLIQPLVGFLLDLQWKGPLHEGVHTYSKANYQKALLILPVFMLLAFLMNFFIKESKPKAHATEPLSSGS